MSAAPDFTGHVAIVTGAGKGLGRAYALWLARHGCAIVVNNRLRDGVSSAQAIVDEIKAFGGKAIAHDGPVEDAASARSMVELARSAFGGTDIVICNAGVQRWADFAELDLDEARRLFDINVWGTLLLLKAAWPLMVTRGYGRIVLTGSGAGLWGQQKSVPYCASKAAMVGIARALALDVPTGVDIRVNVIAPAAYTPMSSDVIDPKWADFMSPDRVAPVVGWLASEACDVTGAIFHAGAGRVRRARTIESVRADLTDDVNAIIHGLDGPSEPNSSFGAGAELMPELFEDLGL